MDQPSKKEQRPHVVCVPYPAQGHVNPMMNLAKILHSQGCHVTFVNNHYNHNRLLRSCGPTSLTGLPTFRFESMPDGLPVPDPNEELPDVTQDVTELTRSLERHGSDALREVINKLMNDTTSYQQSVPKVTCVVLDVMFLFCLDMIRDFGLLAVLFWPAAASSVLGFLQYQKLLDLGIIPFKDTNYVTNGELDRVLDWVPGANNIRLKDIPTFIRTTDRDDFFLNFIIRTMHGLKNASFAIFNTFDALEHDYIQHISSHFPPIYTIGPLKLMLDSFHDQTTKSIRSNLWKEDPKCLKWLDSHQNGSVIYINFGSITIMTTEQLLEFAWGLANSNQLFLWIIRPDLVEDGSIIFSPEYLEKVKDRGLIAGWCDQEAVLAHPAIGGFLTHNGWNSTLESIYNGVPMICWPFFADQQTNCWFCCRKWGVGMEIDTNVKRDEVERQVKELMIGDKGMELRKKVMEWKKLAYDATNKITNGTSYTNLEKVMKAIRYQN